MHILFLTHYFPPEVNAPASRTYENAVRWVRKGHEVTVLTCAPNHPNGILYPGYENRWVQWEERDGVRVLRVKTFLSANKGVKKRILNYVSYMASAAAFSWLVRKVDLVVSTSPQFFCGMAGYFVSRLKRRPWVLEIRDLWPESIISVGAISSRKTIRALEGMETYLYKSADHIISLTRAFKRHIVKRGVAPAKISIITNGVDLDRFQPVENTNGFRREHGLDGKFVAAYIGTHGMAHGLEVVMRAAERLRDRKDIALMLVGDGAERQNLLNLKHEMGLDNLIMLGQQPKERMPEILSATDACMVLLRNTPLFETVIPSKIFEAMGMKRPIILGVRGESREIVEKAGCGLSIPPEDDGALASAVLDLADGPDLCTRMGEEGYRCAVEKYNRDSLADEYLRILTHIHQTRK